ncbi:hypothetical protein HX049_02550 [Myroides odoratimimus]|uniref:hypothetical protein n=1 Tax=Myroides odoratimimus TaxID=76832 RepID=UPI002578954C|nr:hypothetical protein [Myroides odoratimimus]MDM1396060.1 hypothetical protein [Myroides odoratimimus]
MIKVRAITPHGPKFLDFTNRLDIKWDLEDKNNYEYKKKYPDIVLLGKDFEFFRRIELSDRRCEQCILQIVDVSTDGTEKVLFENPFSMSDGKWNMDKCMVTFQIDELDTKARLYEIINDNEKYNVFIDVVEDRDNPILSTNPDHYLELRTNQYLRPSELDLRGYRGMFQRENKTKFIFGREICFCEPGDIPPTEGWNIDTIKDAYQVEGKVKFFRTLDKSTNGIGYGANTGNYGSQYIHNEPIFPELDSGGVEFKSVRIAKAEGRKLSDVLQLLINNDKLGLTLKSDFFQWNPDVVSDINYVTKEKNVWNNIQVDSVNNVVNYFYIDYFGYQKNTVHEISLRELLEDLCNLFNLKWYIEDNSLRLEHVSYFTQEDGIDLLHVEHKDLMRGRTSYKYNTSKLPIEEIWKMKYNNYSKDFEGFPIEYKGLCTNYREDSTVKYEVKTLCTDFFSIVVNRHRESFQEPKLILFAIDEEREKLKTLFSAKSYFSDEVTTNSVLSLAYLHDKLWKHRRKQKDGYMNNQLTKFISIEATKEQDEFPIILTPEEFSKWNPFDRMRTQLGWGIVKSAEYDLLRNSMKLSLKFE